MGLIPPYLKSPYLHDLYNFLTHSSSVSNEPVFFLLLPIYILLLKLNFLLVLLFIPYLFSPYELNPLYFKLVYLEGLYSFLTFSSSPFLMNSFLPTPTNFKFVFNKVKFAPTFNLYFITLFSVCVKSPVS